MFLIMIILTTLGVFVFCMMHKHLLQTLLTLEFLVLFLFLMMFFMILSLGYELYFVLLFLIYSVCEGALGLSILVNMVRNQGNDYLSTMSVLTW